MSPSQDAMSIIYLRDSIAKDIDQPEVQDSLVKIARLVTPGSRVLDIGCSIGALGAYLTRARSCEVDGLDSVAEALEMARPNYTSVKLADLEKESLTELYQATSYDYIIFADVLEHLRQPFSTLAQARNLLNPDGKIIISVPNVTYVGVILEMTAGNFDYRDQGLLDRTHIRFFTERSMKQQVKELGMECALVDLVELPLQDSEFGSYDFHNLGTSDLELYNKATDAGVYQFIFEVSSPEESPSVRADRTLLRKPVLRFNSAVYASREGLEFSESQKASAEMAMDGQFHDARVDLAGFEISTLRFDPSDTEGWILIRRLAFFDAEGLLIWSWDPSDPLLKMAEPHEAQIMWPETASEPTRFHGITRDPYIVLPIPPEKAMLAKSAEFSLAWQTPENVTPTIEIARLSRRLLQLEQENTTLRYEIEDLRNSSSWRLTGPMRSASGIVKNLGTRRQSSQNKPKP